jgi:hypothetical protein
VQTIIKSHFAQLQDDATEVQFLQEAKAGQRIPLSEMWEGIDVE